MNKKPKVLSLVFCELVGLCAILVVSKPDTFENKMTTADNLFSFTFNKLHDTSSGTFIDGVYNSFTSLGNPVAISYTSCSNYTTGGNTYTRFYGDTASFGNTTALGSINEIVFNNVYLAGNIEVECGWYDESTSKIDYAGSVTFNCSTTPTITLDLRSYKPNFVKVYPSKVKTFAFESCTFKYECTQSTTPNIVTVKSDNESYGTVTGSGVYGLGETVNLVATCATFNETPSLSNQYGGYAFKGWYDGSTLVSTNSYYTFSMPNKCINYVAKFEKAKLAAKDIIYHGNYPQSRVTDTTIINKLNTAASYYPEPKNPRKWTIFSWYSNKSTSTEYAWYQDVDYQNVKYRGIYFTKYRPKTVNDTASDTDTSSYQYKNGYIKGNVYWFKYEPIAWRILENNNGDYFVMSNQILDVVQYSNDVTNIQAVSTITLPMPEEAPVTTIDLPCNFIRNLLF